MPPEEKPKALPTQAENTSTTQTVGEEHKIKSLRSYQGDVEEIVSKNNYSASSIMLAEQRKRDGVLIDFSEPKNVEARNKFYIIIGSLLLALGAITIIAVYYNRSKQEVVVRQQNYALVAFSKETSLNLASSTREELIRNISLEKLNFNLPINSILYINTRDNTGNPANINDFLALVAPQMPASLLRSFENKYMLGVYSFDTNEVFLILTTNDFASSFSGMLKWENTMVSDIGRVFGIKVNFESSTPTFTDEALKNKDLRVLKDANNKKILLYSFVDKNTLIITTTENIFSAVLGKYLVGNQAR